MKKVIYLTKNGLLEPLGQSQILPYIKGLSKDYHVTLITFEKRKDFYDKVLLKENELECRIHGINWISKLYPNKSKFYNVFLNFLEMLILTYKHARKEEADIIHARSYLPTFVGCLVSSLIKIEVIFDMRALWPEELIQAGRIKRNSLNHHILSWMERFCVKRSTAIISLTHAAVKYLRSCYQKELKEKSISVIPTCVDLEKFVMKSRTETNPIVYGCVGTILSGWFLTDWLSKWFLLVSEQDSQAHFEIVSRDSECAIHKALPFCRAAQTNVTIGSAKSEDMPSVFARHTVSVMFFSPGIGKLGSAPTRLAEALASGIPIVTNAGVGDVEEIIRKYQVGVIVNSLSHEDLLNAYNELSRLLLDDGLQRRCRETAEIIFSLDMAVASYSTLYKELAE